MILDLEDTHLVFHMKHLSLHWHLEMMAGCWQPELVPVGWYSMMFVESQSHSLYFELTIVQRYCFLYMYKVVYKFLFLEDFACVYMITSLLNMVFLLPQYFSKELSTPQHA